MVKLSWTFAKL